MINVDLNADLGEGLNIEKDIMPFLSSCSIACGGHSWNQASMTDVVEIAILNNVKIGQGNDCIINIDKWFIVIFKRCDMHWNLQFKFEK